MSAVTKIGGHDVSVRKVVCLWEKWLVLVGNQVLPGRAGNIFPAPMEMVNQVGSCHCKMEGLGDHV